MHDHDATPGRPRRSHLLGLIVGFGLLYSLTATWGYEANVDATAAALPAWSLVERGTIDLTEFADLNPWVVEGAGGFYSNRPPGIWLLATPAYALAQSEVFTNLPATATAVAVTVAALAVMYVVLCRITTHTTALIGTILLGAGTSTWTISADALWPHGVVQFWMALSMLALAGGHYAYSGFAYAAATLARPVTFIIPFIQAAYDVLLRRKLRPGLSLIAATLTGLVALVLYNWKVFGRPGIAGGYPPAFAERLTSPDFPTWLTEVFRLMFDPRNGMFLLSPILLVLIPGLRRAWAVAPSWVRGSAISGATYLVIHGLLNRASGGLAFGYRYQLAAITLATPLLVLAWLEWGRHQRLRRLLVMLGALISIAVQLALVFTLECVPIPSTELMSCSLFQF